MKKQYHVNLDPEIVEKAQHQAMDSKLSPILNNLLRVWIEYRKEVEALFNKLKKEKNE